MMGRALVFLVLVGVIMAGCASEVSTKPAEVQKSVTTPTKEPKGSYGNPASIKETVVVKTLAGTFEVTILDYVRGEEAYEVIKRGNMFNPDPEDGYEYLLVKVRFKYASGRVSQFVSAYSFKAYVDGVGFSPSFVILPNDFPEFKDVDLMPGGETEGWITFLVPKGKDVLIAYEYMFEPVCFIKI
ncbi:protein of unknown function {DUF4352} [Geoglobus ahangari]|uniref:DUF4352 domain-containing protein n=1 Tax=Geoglobus ahangari TaxID=113653 RepID=A0A0F7IGQ8_9EURY|nr:DUF4352 domain-containing protein [Geoglobus ahangari]AKG91843.1 protein of unknown function {DUF4352} [Geoglobus ahangari]